MTRAQASSGQRPPTSEPLPWTTRSPTRRPPVGDQPLLAVVMAAYNESGSVGPVLAALPDTLCGLRVCPVVIDDGSSDDTREEALQAGAVVGTHRRNLGQGDALRTGFALAGRLGPAWW